MECFKFFRFNIVVVLITLFVCMYFSPLLMIVVDNALRFVVRGAFGSCQLVYLRISVVFVGFSHDHTLFGLVRFFIGVWC